MTEVEALNRIYVYLHENGDPQEAAEVLRGYVKQRIQKEMQDFWMLFVATSIAFVSIVWTFLYIFGFVT